MWAPSDGWELLLVLAIPFAGATGAAAVVLASGLRGAR